MQISEKPYEEWTEEDVELMMEYEAEKQRKEAEQAEKQRQLKEDQERISREYWERIRSMDEKENADRESGSLDWFMRQAQRRTQASPQVRITNHAANAAAYLAKAYEMEVQRRGQQPTLDRYTQKAVNDCARWATTHTKSGLLLRGYVGVGKTTMLYALATLFDVCEQQKIQIVDARRIATLAKDNRPAYDELFKAPMLGIDDLGTEPLVVKNYGNELSPVAELLTERYNRRAFTIITTNLTRKTAPDGKEVDELQELYGDRLYDRFREQYNTIGYEADQPSYRR